MSMGFLIPPEKAMIWRGPMLHSAVTQFLRDVHWGTLDYLVVDLPPGTGDVQLTFAQALSVTGAVIVSTPQDIALIDARKGLNMFLKVDVPVFGLIENMSYFVCPKDGEKYYIFGSGGGKREAERLKVPFIGEIPIEASVCEGGDQGIPVLINQKDSSVVKAFKECTKVIFNHVLK